MSAYEKLDEAYADARKELERSLQSVRNTLAAFDDDLLVLQKDKTLLTF